MPPTRAAVRGRGWYRGDCHVHSDRSTSGELTPHQLAAAARAAGLDFVAVTEHNTTDTHAAWLEEAAGDLLVILGQEVVTRDGHWLALGIPPGRLVDGEFGVADDVVRDRVKAVHLEGGICVVAHPHAPYPSGTFAYAFDGFDLVEVWNGQWTSDLPWNADNEAALADWDRSVRIAVPDERWRPAIGNSDAHLAGQIGVPHSVVLANELSSVAVLDALRRGRAWIAESRTVELSLVVSAGDRRAVVGERLVTRREPCTARVAIRGTPSAVVSVHTRHGPVHRVSLPPAGAGVVEWHTNAQESGYIRVEVRHPDGRMAALTNPVVLV